MAIDLDRPPARLPPRLTDYAVVAIAWGAIFVLVIFSTVISRNFPPGEATLLLVLGLQLAVLLIALYLTIRIGWRAIVYSWATNLRQYAPIGGADLDRRAAVPEEVEARRLLRKGRITRAAYERRIAYRRFVHGEISRAEYHARLTDIETASATARRK